MPQYDQSQELEELALQIIGESHALLTQVEIGYVFRAEAVVSRGRVVYGMTVRVDDRNHVFSGKDIIIEIGEDAWRSLTPDLRKMVMDHELCHVLPELDDKGKVVIMDNGRRKVGIRPHDFEDFEVIMDRYPTARKDLKAITLAFLAGKSKDKEAAKTPKVPV